MIANSKRPNSPTFLPILFIHFFLFHSAFAVKYQIFAFVEPATGQFQQLMKHLDIPITYFEVNDTDAKILQRLCNSTKPPFVINNGKCLGTMEQAQLQLEVLAESRSALSDAVRQGNVDRARELLNFADPNWKINGKNAWKEMIDVHKCHPELMKLLQEVGEKVYRCQLNSVGMNVQFNLYNSTFLTSD
jgi:hypothetical protein